MKTVYKQKASKMKTVKWGSKNQCIHTYQMPTLKYKAKDLSHKMKGKWIKIGVCGVDTGRLMIIDPCYRGMLSEKEEDGIIWDSGIAPMIQYHYPKGHAGLGVSFSTGFGDGCYDVYGLVEDTGTMGLRIVEVRIRFC